MDVILLKPKVPDITIVPRLDCAFLYLEFGYKRKLVVSWSRDSVSKKRTLEIYGPKPIGDVTFLYLKIITLRAGMRFSP